MSVRTAQAPALVVAHPTVLVLDAPACPGAPEAEVFEAESAEVSLVFAEDLDRDASDDTLSRADVILTWRVDLSADCLERARRCLLAAHYGPGAGPRAARVDLETARRLGIYVASVPDYFPEDWADETFRLMLTLARGGGGGGAGESAGVRRPPRALAGLRLGLVGLGSVGRLVARRARAFGMRLHGCDPFAPPEHFDGEGVARTELPELMGLADVVSLHVPLGPATRGMISGDLLSLMKSDAILIGTAAPELVDLDALAGTMARGRPAAAAFDADLAALLPPDHPLLARPGLFHGAARCGAGVQCADAVRRRAARLALHVLRGGRPPHLQLDPPWPRLDRFMAGIATG
jgi:D-3-phosphoglycerate dehydrogenase